MESEPAPILSGKGLHGGRPARVRFRLGEPSTAGVRLSFPGLGTLPVAELARMPRTDARSTRLGSGAASIGTPEHLLAALLFFSEPSLDVECDAPELPGLDGSALPYRHALSRLFPSAAASPAWKEYPTDLDWEYHWSYGCLRIRPASRFSVRWELDRGPLRQSFTLADAAAAFREVLPARTFAFHREWREASARGLMAGADEGSGLLLAESEAEHRELMAARPEWRGGPFPLLNQAGWRVEDEPVKHKVLDLLGDLALAGLALPRAEIEIRNGGHGVNHLLLDRLLAETPARTA
jgi:UDP-3-O-acyl-N-acetylglucosamine deacetylase